MGKDIKISKVEIEIAGKTLDLTLTQAKELRDILCEAFPVDKPMYYVPSPLGGISRPYDGGSITGAVCSGGQALSKILYPNVSVE